MMVKSRRAGRVVAPSFSTSASKLPRTPTSRSVVVRLNFVAVGLQQNVRKNGQRGAGADDVLDLLQTLEEFFFRDAKFHEGGNESLRCKAFDFIRQPQSRSAGSALQRAVDE